MEVNHALNKDVHANILFQMNDVRARMGWKSEEDALLWKEAELARKAGKPLKSVFDNVADKTGRKPNSIRNYYYARRKDDGESSSHNPAFVPFTAQEIWNLLENVLSDQAKGISVRACTLRLGEGDNKAMLRYQNKYRSLIKTNPALVRRVAEHLRESGIEAFDPYEAMHQKRKRRKSAEAFSTDGLEDAIGMIAAVEGIDLSGFLGGLKLLSSYALAAQENERAVREMSELGDDERQERMRIENEALKRQNIAQKERFGALLNLFQRLVRVNREFLGLNSMVKVSSLSTYIRDLSRSVEDCENLMRAEAL